MKKALLFGAGNIGRGFIGKLLADSGYKVIFADVNENIINTLNIKKSYNVNIVGNDFKIEEVKNVDGVLSNSKEIPNIVTEVDIICTAVGAKVLPLIAKTIAEGLMLRNAKNKHPLNIIACENMLNNSSFLETEVIKHIAAGNIQAIKDNTGFVNCAVDRIVPPTKNSNDILEVTVEEFSEWIVDETQFKGKIPTIDGMQKTNNLFSFIERKLFTLNTGHLATAYLTLKANLKTIDEGIINSVIRDKVIEVMEESGEVLIKRHGFDETKHNEYIKKIIKRFENPYLKDEAIRVGREPIRKLGKDERLIKPLLGTIEYSTKNSALIEIIALALNYYNPEDSESITLQEFLKNHSVKETLQKFSGLDNSFLLYDKITETYSKISK